MSIIYKVVIKRKVTRALENAYAQGQSDCMEGKIKIKLADENSLKNEYYSFLGIKLTIFRKQQFYFIEYPLDDEKESAMNPNNY